MTNDLECKSCGKPIYYEWGGWSHQNPENEPYCNQAIPKNTKEVNCE